MGGKNHTGRCFLYLQLCSGLIHTHLGHGENAARCWEAPPWWQGCHILGVRARRWKRQGAVLGLGWKSALNPS